MSAFGSVVAGSVPIYLPNPPQSDDLFGRTTGVVRSAVERLEGPRAVPTYGQSTAGTVAGIDLAPVGVAVALVIILILAAPYLARLVRKA